MVTSVRTRRYEFLFPVVSAPNIDPTERARLVQTRHAA